MDESAVPSWGQLDIQAVLVKNPAMLLVSMVQLLNPCTVVAGAASLSTLEGSSQTDAGSASAAAPACTAFPFGTALPLCTFCTA